VYLGGREHKNIVNPGRKNCKYGPECIGIYKFVLDPAERMSNESIDSIIMFCCVCVQCTRWRSYDFFGGDI